jgi:hypothetical protein
MTASATRRWCAAIVVIGSLGCAALDCTLLTSRNGLQCTKTTDCWARGPAFSSTICTSEGVCSAVEAGDASVSLGCVSSSECEFALGGAAGRCVESKCVPLTTGSFCVVVGPASQDNAVLVGVLVPLSGLAAAEVQILGQSPAPFINVVLDDFNTSVSNADAGTNIKPPPQFAALVCDESQLSDSLGVLKNLHVSFLVGPTSEATLQTILAEKAFTVISPLGDGAIYANSESADPAHQQWFVSSNRASGATAFASLISSVSGLVAQQRYPKKGGGPPGPIKLAFAYDSVEPNEQAFAAAMTPLITVNGSPATGNPSFVSVDGNTSITDPTGTTAAATSSAVAFEPDVVVLAGPLWASSFVNTLETRWSLLNPENPSPVYVMWRVLPSISDFAKSSHWPVNKMFALDGYRDSTVTLNQGVIAERFASAEINVGTTVEAPYGLTNYSDALFSGLYGLTVAAAGGAGTGVTAAELAAGLDGVSQGTQQVSLVSGDILTMLGLIQSKTQTLMVGGTNYLGFDPTLGIPILGLGQTSAPAGFAAFCISKSGAYQWKSAGVTYAVSDQTPSGTFACP